MTAGKYKIELGKYNGAIVYYLFDTEKGRVVPGHYDSMTEAILAAFEMMAG